MMGAPMTAPAAPADRHRRTKLIAAIVAAMTIVSLLALVVIVAREQISGSAIAVHQGRDSGDADGQRVALEALLAQDPHDDTAVAELAALATADGRWLEAARQWGTLAKLDPLHPDARFEQARALLAAGDVPGAEAALAEAGGTLDSRSHALVARAALLRGDLARARDAVAQAEAADPDLPAVQLLLADLAFLDGDDERAKPRYTRLAGDPETAAAAAIGLAQIALRAGDTEAALAALVSVPGDAGRQALTARASLYRQMGRTGEAEQDYRALMDAHGPLPDLVVPLAELRGAAQDAAAVMELRRALAGTDAADLAARHYLQAIERYLGGDAAAARDYLGWAADFFSGRDLYRWMQLDVGAELGDPALVTAALTRIQAGVVSPERRARVATLLTERAAAFADGGDAARAQMLADAALGLLPDFASAQLVAARAALLAGDDERARALASALEDDPEHRAAALEVSGRAALAADDFDGAAAQFRALAEALPEAAVGSYWQGVTAARAGDLAAAEALLREAYRRRADPRIEAALMDVLMQRADWSAADALATAVAASSDAATRARGLAYRGGLLEAQGELAPAAAAYAEAASADPRRAPYALAAADLLMAQSRWDDARAVLATAAAQHPDNRYIAFKRALLAQRAGAHEEAEQRYRDLLVTSADWALPLVNLSELLDDTAEALTLAERAAALAPDWPDAHWNLAQRRAALGDDGGAAEAARAVLGLAPEHAEARALLDRLGSARPGGAT
jgi:cellulose synthase operon protein C